MPNEKKNILLIGQGAVVSALAKKISKSAGIGKVYAAPGNLPPSEYFTQVDIREEDLTGLLKFALENEITLTIPVTAKALKSDVVTFFVENGQNIFGSGAETCKIMLNNASCKKFLYKIHAQTSKFGVFDKLQPAADYLKSANFPVTIKCNEYNNIEDRLVCTTNALAGRFLDEMFSRGETNVLIEEYVYGSNFTVYFITDGYSALPVTAVKNYKFTEDGDGGILTGGVGCYTPDFRVSDVVISRVGNIVRNTLNSLERKGTPYLGILGVECTSTGEDKFYVNELKPFWQDFDAAAVLNIINSDLIEIFMACIDGLFSDEWTEIKLNNLSSVSAVVSSRGLNKPITGLEKIDNSDEIDFINVQKTTDDKYLTQKGLNFVLTKTAATLNHAKNGLYEDLSCINFDGIKYRKDILRG